MVTLGFYFAVLLVHTHHATHSAKAQRTESTNGIDGVARLGNHPTERNGHTWVHTVENGTEDHSNDEMENLDSSFEMNHQAESLSASSADATATANAPCWNHAMMTAPADESANAAYVHDDVVSNQKTLSASLDSSVALTAHRPEKGGSSSRDYWMECFVPTPAVRKCRALRGHYL